MTALNRLDDPGTKGFEPGHGYTVRAFVEALSAERGSDCGKRQECEEKEGARAN